MYAALRSRHAKRIFTFSLLCPLLACGASEDAADSPDSDASVDTGDASDDSAALAPLAYMPCATGARVGDFGVQLASDFTAVQGWIRSGVVPAEVPEEVASEGGCQLMRARSLFCDPGCNPGETCGEGGVCIPYPTNLTVGVVNVEGLSAEVALEPRAPINLYANSGTLPHPGFETGADIRMRAEGGDQAAFSLRGQGVEALVTSEVGQVAGGQPLPVSWEATTQTDAARIQLRLDLDNHGASLGWITCVAEDTGSFEVPASLIDGLLALGVSGFPSISMSRRTTESAMLDAGCVEFSVFSEAELSLEVEGVISCGEDADCASNNCRGDLTCGE